MVRIPSYQSQVTVTPPRVPQQVIPETPRAAFGEDVARASASISQVIDPIANLFARRAEERRRIDNATYAANIQMMYMDAVHDRLFSDQVETHNQDGQKIEKTRGLMLREKDQASGSVFEFDDFYQSEAPKYLDMIKDPAERLRFQQMMMNDYQSKKNALIKNEVQQKHIYDVDSQMSNIDKYIQEFASVQSDKDLIDKLKILDGKSQTLYSDTQGKDFNQTKALKQKDAEKGIDIYLRNLVSQGRVDEALAQAKTLDKDYEGTEERTRRIVNKIVKDAEEQEKQAKTEREIDLIQKVGLGESTIGDINSINQMVLSGEIGSDIGRIANKVITEPIRPRDMTQDDESFVSFMEGIMQAGDREEMRNVLKDVISSANKRDMTLLVQTAMKVGEPKAEVKRRVELFRSNYWRVVNYADENGIDKNIMVRSYTDNINRDIDPSEAADLAIENGIVAVDPRYKRREDKKEDLPTVMVNEGEVILDIKTGQRMQMVNGRWVSIQ